MVLACWLFYVAFSPLYFFPSGLPQISDIVLMLGVMPFLTLRFMGFRGAVPPLYLVGALFVFYTIFINMINFAFYPEIRFVLTSLIYFFNFLVLAFVIIFFRQDPDTAKNYTFYALALSVLIQLLAVLFLPQTGWRAMGTFNNPNQLAYWGVLTSVMLVFLKRGSVFNILDYALLFIIAYIESKALSKAGIISYAVFWFLLVLTPQVSKKLKAGLLMLVVFSSIVVVFSSDIFSPISAGRFEVLDRLENIGQENDDSAAARGYTRLIDFPEYTLFGAGEGAFWRFDDLHVRELHSGLATIVFSYGIFGACLFGALLLIMFRPQPWYYVSFLGVILMFGLVHQNFRTTDFWVFLGISYASMWFGNRRRRQAIVQGQAL